MTGCLLVFLALDITPSAAPSSPSLPTFPAESPRRWCGELRRSQTSLMSLPSRPSTLLLCCCRKLRCSFPLPGALPHFDGWLLLLHLHSGEERAVLSDDVKNRDPAVGILLGFGPCVGDFFLGWPVLTSPRRSFPKFLKYTISPLFAPPHYFPPPLVVI